LWIEGRQGTVSRVDLSTHKVIRKFVIGSLGRLNIAADRRGVWFAAPGSDYAAHIDARAKDASYVSIADYGRARGGRVLPGIEDNPGGVAAGAGAVWITLWSVNKLLRIDPTTNVVATAITVGENPAAVAVGKGAVWVANAGSGTVSRIDPASNRVVKTVKVGNRPAGIAVTSGAVWVTVQ
jgi:YVTN family beta-propeller protein